MKPFNEIHTPVSTVNSCDTVASAAMPAVSARNTFGPKLRGIHPAFNANSRSRSAHPPSGPNSNATLSSCDKANPTNNGPCRNSSSKIRREACICRASSNFTGASNKGKVIRRHC